DRPALAALRAAQNAAAATAAAAPTRQALPDATPPTDRGRSGIPRRGGGAAQRLGIELAFERPLAGGDDERHRPAPVDNRDVEQRSPGAALGRVRNRSTRGRRSAPAS